MFINSSLFNTDNNDNFTNGVSISICPFKVSEFISIKEVLQFAMAELFLSFPLIKADSPKVSPAFKSAKCLPLLVVIATEPFSI